jgi:hypothetical protein
MSHNRLLEFIKEIEENPRIDLKSLKKEVFEIDPFFSQMQIDSMKNHLGAEIKTDSAVITFYPISNTELSYSGKTYDFLYGGFQFFDWWLFLCTVSEFWKIDFSLAPNENIPQHLKPFENLCCFEKQKWRDDWRYGCFYRETGIFPPKTAFFDKNWYTIMDLSFDEYVDSMICSCAVMGWQYFYIDFNQEIPHLNRAVNDMEIAIKNLPELFPEKDFSFHKERLKELKTIKKIK